MISVADRLQFSKAGLFSSSFQRAGLPMMYFADAPEIALITGNVFIEIALPDRRAQHAAGGVHFPRGYGFEILHDRGQRP